MAVVYSREARSFASISEIDIPLSHPAKTMANSKAASGLKVRTPCSFVVIIILLFIIVFVDIVIVILVVEVVIVLVVNFVIIEFIVVVL